MWTVLVLTGITHKAGANLLLGIAYTLDASGMRTAVDEQVVITRQVAYTYDQIKRLTGEAVTQAVGNRSTTWTYDGVGNRLTQVKTTTTGTDTTAYSYDANDRLTQDVTNGANPGTTTYGYDDAGNQTRRQDAGGVTDYVYDDANRMAQLRAINGDVARYAYDHDGIRLNQTIKVGKIAEATTHYLVDPNISFAQVIEEHVQHGDNGIALSSKYAIGNDRVRASRAISAPTASISVHYYNADGLGSTRMLTDIKSDVTDYYSYDASGVMDAEASAVVSQNPFGYIGKYLDQDAGSYYLRARYLDLGSTRFTQADTIDGHAATPITLNRYIY